MKYCEEFGALLDLYADGELSGAEAARVREHLESCSGCRAYVDGVLAVRAAFPAVEETAVPEGFAEGVMAAVRELEAAGAERKLSGARRYARWRGALLPLAACFAVVVVLRAVAGGEGVLPAANSSVAPAAMEAAPQMEMADDVSPEAGAVLKSREAPEEPAAPQDGSFAVSGDTPADSAAPQSEEGVAAEADTSGAEKPAYGRVSRTVRLTAEQAGELLADRPYTAEEGGVRCYRLLSEDFDALLSALAERDIVPLEGAPKAETLPEGYDFVYVTEE